MEAQLSIEIDRPIEEVFEYTLTNVAEWSITCVEDELIEEKPEGVGTTFRVVTEDCGRRMEFRGTVTQHDPPHFSAMRLEGDAFDIDVDYTFEDLSGRTRVTHHSVVHGKGFYKVMFLLFGWMMRKSGCKAQENELASLKQFCEGRAG